jgi:hypothetical protein
MPCTKIHAELGDVLGAELLEHADGRPGIGQRIFEAGRQVELAAGEQQETETIATRNATLCGRNPRRLVIAAPFCGIGRSSSHLKRARESWKAEQMAGDYLRRIEPLESAICHPAGY